ncbi:tetratricopeptide (TPR) repeat protein [Altererythrobacter atlanticus]|uniref:Tetratricopeptide repeat protein n=1 Tax=Croceibacterium atlanticum TaxID=1267766 RepID=A0A0F7KU86_9SPHN|nr:tetratricopeptide repeat protein [Croceibacterium atlanticum]AKH43169.1 Tetratricopeptide repeat protein [Croceibacterium atlanticum]MBB5732126.1 tetratricopeptide (TPR) repeat protein [Croceibacterium atlanticum]
MPAIAIASLLLAQSAAALPPLQQDRLKTCLAQARTDPATAIVTASGWLSEAAGPDRSLPQQCLGTAYTSLLRWDAAESAFLAARTAALDSEPAAKARFATMAGNAALAAGNYPAALSDFDLALADADTAQDGELIGSVETDRARALVALGREDDAANALERARESAPQNGTAWLLSATLARRQDDLASAQALIETAGALLPADPAVGLEAGVIAALAGDDEAAAKSWQSVVDTAPNSPEAATALGYLSQIGEAQVRGR